MNVAALELDSSRRTAATADDGLREAGGEWIDPEGDDWLASMYRFLTEDQPRPVDTFTVTSIPVAELELWFG